MIRIVNGFCLSYVLLVVHRSKEDFAILDTSARWGQQSLACSALSPRRQHLNIHASSSNATHLRTGRYSYAMLFSTKQVEKDVLRLTSATAIMAKVTQAFRDSKHCLIPSPDSELINEYTLDTLQEAFPFR